MDFDPRDYDSRDDERRLNEASPARRSGSDDRERADDWSQPGVRTRDRDDDGAPALGRGPGNERQESDEHGRDRDHDLRWASNFCLSVGKFNRKESHGWPDHAGPVVTKTPSDRLDQKLRKRLRHNVEPRRYLLPIGGKIRWSARLEHSGAANRPDWVRKCGPGRLGTLPIVSQLSADARSANAKFPNVRKR
jgi:hypothetical protein